MSFLNYVPGVGHVKGVGHYIVGDVKGGNEAMVKATRSTAVAGAGVAGFAVAGPLGAGHTAFGATALWDSAETAVRNKPTGIIWGLPKLVGGK